MFGTAVWLHSRTGEYWPVDRHEKWLAISANQALAEIPDYIRKEINHTPPAAADYADIVRTLGLRAGLIRIRPYRNETSVQFYAPPYQVRGYLWTIYQYFQEHKPTDYLSIGNLYNNDIVKIEVPELKQRLEADTTIMLEDEIRDIPMNSPIIKRLNKMLDRHTQTK